MRAQNPGARMFKRMYIKHYGNCTYMQGLKKDLTRRRIFMCIYPGVYRANDVSNFTLVGCASNIKKNIHMQRR